MSEYYVGIIQNAKSTVKIQGSIFYGFAYTIREVAEIKGILKQLQKEYPDASHICYAYKLGNAEQASDAGEPSHSAGTPILRKIHSKGLDCVMVCVVRYFGGTKLGIPGLIAAYGESAELTLENAGFRQYAYIDQYRITCAEEDSYQVYTFANKIGGSITMSEDGYFLSLERQFTSRIQEASENFPKLRIKKVE